MLAFGLLCAFICPCTEITEFLRISENMSDKHPDSTSSCRDCVYFVTVPQILECSFEPVQINLSEMELKNEWTGSTFEGERLSGWFEGYGRYRFASGVIYEGQFHKGDFHGEGVLIYPNGGKYKAKWTRGIATNGQYTFNDGLEYKVKDWDYITAEDRRFYQELTNGFRPAGNELLPSESGEEEIPAGTYNTRDGFFEPSARKIYSFDGQQVIGEPEPNEVKWIMRQCRKQLTDVANKKEHGQVVGCPANVNAKK